MGRPSWVDVSIDTEEGCITAGGVYHPATGPTWGYSGGHPGDPAEWEIETHEVEVCGVAVERELTEAEVEQLHEAAALAYDGQMREAYDG